MKYTVPSATILLITIIFASVEMLSVTVPLVDLSDKSIEWSFMAGRSSVGSVNWIKMVH